MFSKILTPPDKLLDVELKGIMMSVGGMKLRAK
jgi:hypothetical protein